MKRLGQTGIAKSGGVDTFELMLGALARDGFRVVIYGTRDEFFLAEALEYIDKHLPPEMRENEEIRAQARKIVFDEGLVPQEAYVAPGELLGELRRKYPQTFDKIEIPMPDNTRGTSTLEVYTRQPGLLTRLMPVMAGTRWRRSPTYFNHSRRVACARPSS